VTREQAERESERLTLEHPDRATNIWLAQHAGDEWRVVKLPRPAGGNRGPFKSEERVQEKPDEPPDPRPTGGRMPGPYGG